MAELDLGTLRGHVDLDASKFDKKYADVINLLETMERRKDPEVSVDADTSQAEQRLNEVQDKVLGIDGESGEVSVTGDSSHAEEQLQTAEKALGALDGETAELEVDADATKAEDAIEQVEQAGETLARREFDPQIDADITKADKKVSDVKRELEVLGRMEANPKVEADIAKAQSNLGDAESRLKALQGMRAEMVVEADTAPAETAIGGLGAEGEAAGDEAGQGLSKKVIAALATIPIAGAVVGIGAAIGGALIAGIQDGLSVELSRDLFAAKTGLDAATAQRFGLAAGNSYASAFGESTEANLETARNALQQGLIDKDATQAEISEVINQLTGITEVFEYDIPAASRAVGQMLKTGLVSDATEAFDLITKTSQGAISDDLLDTLNEYSGQFEQVGLTGADAMGLIRQGMDAGARDTDKVADAVKEMGLRIREGTDPAIEAMEILGVDVDKVREGFNKGGPAAREAMQTVFEALGTVQERGGNTQQVIADLFGGPGEDLGAALFALDLDKASQALGETEGAADRLLTTLGDNAATEIDGAKRAIETGADGIKAALAAAFSDDLVGAADWVAANRGPMLEFFKEAANGALDFAESGLEGAAAMTEGFTGFVSGVLPPFLDGLGNAAIGMAALTGNVEMAGAGAALKTAADGARELGENGQTAADDIRGLGGGLDDIRRKFNDEIDPQIMSAKVHDAVTEMVGRVEELGAAFDDVEGEVTINGDTMNAEEAMEALMGTIDEETGEVTINGETVPAEEALDYLMGQVDESEGDVTIAASRAPADEVLTALMDSVENSRDNVTIGGNDVPADRVLRSLMGSVRESSDDVTIGGNDYPAETVLSQLMRAVRNGKENVTIGGNRYPADGVLRSLLGTVGRSGSSISVGANAASAYSGVNTLVSSINQRVATIQVRANMPDLNGASSGSGRMGTYAEGGPITGPGTGTSDDVPIMASNGEYMIRAAAVEKYGFGLLDSLNALHLAEGGPVSGASPGVANYYQPAPATSGGPTVASLASEDRELMRQFIEVAKQPLVAKLNGREFLSATRSIRTT